MTAPVLSSRADWRALHQMVHACVQDVAEPREGADLRLMELKARTRSVSYRTLDREVGATAGSTARALIHLVNAFGTAASPTRPCIAPAMLAAANLLDDRLHAAAEAEFNRAHAGRPEVFG